MLELRNGKKNVWLKEHGLKICGETHSKVEYLPGGIGAEVVIKTWVVNKALVELPTTSVGRQ